MTDTTTYEYEHDEWKTDEAGNLTRRTMFHLRSGERLSKCHQAYNTIISRIGDEELFLTDIAPTVPYEGAPTSDYESISIEEAKIKAEDSISGIAEVLAHNVRKRNAELDNTPNETISEMLDRLLEEVVGVADGTREQTAGADIYDEIAGIYEDSDQATKRRITKHMNKVDKEEWMFARYARKHGEPHPKLENPELYEG